jgi:hypothetical protein
VPLDRNARARFLWLCRMHRAPGRLSSSALQVAVVLVRLLGADGRLDPAHSTLARLARVHVATVQRALDRMRTLGLLSWRRRLVRSGWRVVQTSSAYVLTPGAAETPVAVTDLQTARPVKVVSLKKAGIEAEWVAPEVRQAAQAMLDAVRQRRMQVLGLV